MIPFSPPRIDQLIIDEVIDTLKSGWITTGPKTKLFEKRLTKYSGCKATLCLNSATAGLELMLRWFGVGPGDEVIVPAYTYCATANVVVHCGAKPVMVDVNAHDFNINPQKVREAITPRTKVIMPVDIAGFPCDYDDLYQIVNDKDVRNLFRPSNGVQQQLGRILILADAAHSLGASYKGAKIGSVADITVFSFHAVKNLTTAEGGAVALNLPDPFDNQALYQYLCIYSLHGQSKDALAKMQKGAWRYDVIEAGYKANMTDIQASIGLIELARYDNDTLVKRRQVCEFYNQHLGKYDWAILPPLTDGDKVTSYHAYLLRIKGVDESQRDRIIQRIFDRDVSVNVHFQPLPLLTAYKKLGYDINDYPVAYRNYAQEISLPVFYDITDQQQQQVVESVVQSVKEVLA
ncbi:MAG: DegT/DnrJ/EryC1/StrS aminotransferase family protein [Bacteroidales bacterium]|nr:DegT/DnrJ/EryC1/StrS aminotransferase family protein [Bacteroidales bacterium]